MDDLAEKDQESAWEKVGVETFVPASTPSGIP